MSEFSRKDDSFMRIEKSSSAFAELSDPWPSISNIGGMIGY